MKKQNIKKIVEIDYYRNKGKKLNKYSILKLFLRRKTDPMKFIYCWRYANYYRKTPVLNIISKIMYNHYSRKYNFEIPLKVQIGAGIRLPHWAGGIVINENAVIGENCEIMQGCTIGNNIMKSRKAVATIGDNVIIGAGAKVIGELNIGDNIFIGANSVVTHDIPSNTCVAGVPAKVLQTNFEPIIINDFKQEVEIKKLKLYSIE